MPYGSLAVGDGKEGDMSGWLDIGRLNPRARSGFPATGKNDQGVGSGFLATGGDDSLRFNTV